jgi:hypothetical protein
MADSTHSNRDEIVHARINDIGRESFPDNADVLWKALKIVDVGAYSFVEAEAHPPTVGYPKFIFVLLFGESDQPSVVGCYEGDGNRWGLLFTAPNAPSDWEDLFPKAQLTEGTGRFWERERDQIIQEKINEIGRETFPEDTEVSWEILKIVHAGEYSFVEAKPDPSTVGYPKFILVLAFAKNGKPFEVGCYCFDRNRWGLLSTSEGTSSDWQDLFPEEEFSDRTKGAGCAGVVLVGILVCGVIVCIA